VLLVVEHCAGMRFPHPPVVPWTLLLMRLDAGLLGTINFCDVHAALVDFVVATSTILA
jgi:hypothetical protein